MSIACEYLFRYALFVIPSGFSMLFKGFCRNDGAPGLVGWAVCISTVLNIFGDWLLIFPFKMGLKGAAIATGVSQCVTLAIVITYILRKKGNLYLKPVKVDFSLVQKLLVRGFPEWIAQLATPVMTLCMNIALGKHIGDMGVNAFSIINYVASFSMAVFFGTGEGLQPLFGLCFGAKNDKDLRYYLRMGIIINIVGSLFINLVLLCHRQKH